MYGVKRGDGEKTTIVRGFWRENRGLFTSSFGVRSLGFSQCYSKYSVYSNPYYVVSVETVQVTARNAGPFRHESSSRVLTVIETPAKVTMSLRELSPMPQLLQVLQALLYDWWFGPATKCPDFLDIGPDDNVVRAVKLEA